jgi:hypothetical protein
LTNLFGLTPNFYDTLLAQGKSMATNISLEERMAAVEEAISELREQVAIPQPTNWLQQINGSFKDDPAFEEVLAYGRAIRVGDESLLGSEHQE